MVDTRLLLWCTALVVLAPSTALGEEPPPLPDASAPASGPAAKPMPPAAAQPAAAKPAAAKPMPPAAAKPAAERPAAAKPAAAPAAPKPVGAPPDPGGVGGGIEPGPRIDPVARPGKPGKHEVATEARLRRPERALIGLELAGALAVPLKNYLDFGSGNNRYFMENGLGGGMALSLTLNDIEVRWTYTLLGTGQVTGRIPDEALVGLQLIQQLQGKTGTITQNIDKAADGPLVMHAITLGYRLTFEPSRIFRLVVPFGAGLVAAQPPSFGLLSYTLFGFAAHVGLRGEVLLKKMLAVGLDTRFSIYVTEPDPNLGAAGYAATKNAFDAAVAWLPMLSIALHARLYY